MILDAVARRQGRQPERRVRVRPGHGQREVAAASSRPAIPDLLRDRVVPVADIITPNQFELGY